jgi:hypothetical protein
MPGIILDASAPPIHHSPIIKTKATPVTNSTQPQVIQIFLMYLSSLSPCDHEHAFLD